MGCKICGSRGGCSFYKNMFLCSGCSTKMELEDKLKEKNEEIKMLLDEIQRKDKRMKQPETTIRYLEGN